MFSTSKVIYIVLVIKLIFLLNCECQSGMNLKSFSNTTCQNDRFNCSNGQIIPCSEVCDGRKNCADSSDETFLACRNVYCTDDQFRCSYGGCISSSLECNGFQDCVDNSDEISLNCPGVLSTLTRNKNCSFGFFQCDDLTCIREDQICDGKQDCRYFNSDETEELCSNQFCAEENFRCNYGACILPIYVCDGVKNCFDGSDEHDQCPKSTSSGVGTNSSVIFPDIDSGILDGKTLGALPTERPPPPSSEYNPPTPTKRPDVLTPSSEWNLLNVYRSMILRILQDLNQMEQNIRQTVQNEDTKLYQDPSQIHRNLESPLTIPAPASSSIFFPITSSSQPPKNDDLKNNNLKLFRTGAGFEGRTNDNVNEAHCSSVPLNSLSVQASCRTQTGETISCSGLLPIGTVAILTCKVGYRKPDTVVNDAVTCTETGEWDAPLFKCQQDCGIIHDAEATIVGGFKTNITQVPWHAAIYEARPGKVEQICGGSIINPTAIVTAAHCFWNGQKQEVYPAARYRVIVGKTLREFSASEPLTQMFKIKTIDTYDQYRDYNGLFVADIAVLVLEKPIIFAPHIKPICIEFSLKNNERYVASGLTGRVAGWGLTSSGGESSSVLKVIDMPTVDYNTCIKVSPPDFVPFVTSDKFCGGFTTGESVCVGDSGGAMALARPVGKNQVYFLKGIVSTGPRLENSCDNNKYSAFTDVQLNIVFLYKYISNTN